MPDHYLLCATEAKFVTNKPHTLIVTCGMETYEMLIKISEAKIKRRSNDTIEISTHAVSPHVSISTTSTSWMYSVRTKGGKTAGRPPQQYIQMKRMGVYHITSMEHVTHVSLRVGDMVYDLPHWTQSEHSQRMASLPTSPSHRSRAVMRRDQYLHECKEHVVVRRMAEYEPMDQPRMKKMRVEESHASVMTTTSSTWVPEHDSPVSAVSTPNSVSGEFSTSYGLDFHCAPMPQVLDPCWSQPQGVPPISQSQYMGFSPSPRYSALTSPRLPPLSHEEMDLFGGVGLGLDGYKPEMEDGGAHDFAGSLLAPLSPAGGFGADLIDDGGILEGVDVSPHSVSPSPSSSPTSPSQGSSQPPMERSLSSFSFSSDSDLSLEDALDVQLDELTAMGEMSGIQQQMVQQPMVSQQQMVASQHMVSQQQIEMGISPPYLDSQQPYISSQQSIQQGQSQIGLAPMVGLVPQDLQIPIQNYVGLQMDMTQGSGISQSFQSTQVISSQSFQPTQIIPYQSQYSQIPISQDTSQQIPLHDTSQVSQIQHVQGLQSQSHVQVVGAELAPLQSSQSIPSQPILQSPQPVQSQSILQSPQPIPSQPILQPSQQIPSQHVLLSQPISQPISSTGFQQQQQRPHLGQPLLVLQSSQLSAGLLFNPTQSRQDVRISSSRDTMIQLAISQHRMISSTSSFQPSAAVSPTPPSSQSSTQQVTTTLSIPQVTTRSSLITQQSTTQSIPQVISHVSSPTQQISDTSPGVVHLMQTVSDTSPVQISSQLVSDTSQMLSSTPIPIVDASPGPMQTQLVDTSPGRGASQASMVAGTSRGGASQPQLVDPSPSGVVSQAPTTLVDTSPESSGISQVQAQAIDTSPGIGVVSQSLVVQASTPLSQGVSSRSPSQSSPRSVPASQQSPATQSSPSSVGSHLMSTILTLSLLPSLVPDFQQRPSSSSSSSSRVSQHDVADGGEDGSIPLRSHSEPHSSSTHDTSQSPSQVHVPSPHPRHSLQAQAHITSQSSQDLQSTRLTQATTSSMVQHVVDHSRVLSQAQVTTPTQVLHTSDTQHQSIQNQSSVDQHVDVQLPSQTQSQDMVTRQHMVISTTQSSTQSQHAITSQSSSQHSQTSTVVSSPSTPPSQVMESQRSQQPINMDMDIQSSSQQHTISMASTQQQSAVLIDSCNDVIQLLNAWLLTAWLMNIMIFSVFTFLHILLILLQIMSSTTSQHDLVQEADETATQMDSPLHSQVAVSIESQSSTTPQDGFFQDISHTTEQESQSSITHPSLHRELTRVNGVAVFPSALLLSSSSVQVQSSPVVVGSTSDSRSGGSVVLPLVLPLSAVSTQAPLYPSTSSAISTPSGPQVYPSPIETDISIVSTPSPTSSISPISPHDDISQLSGFLSQVSIDECAQHVVSQDPTVAIHHESCDSHMVIPESTSSITHHTSQDMVSIPTMVLVTILRMISTQQHGLRNGLRNGLVPHMLWSPSSHDIISSSISMEPIHPFHSLYPFQSLLIHCIISQMISLSCVLSSRYVSRMLCMTVGMISLLPSSDALMSKKQSVVASHGDVHQRDGSYHPALSFQWKKDDMGKPLYDESHHQNVTKKSILESIRIPMKWSDMYVSQDDDGSGVSPARWCTAAA